MLKHHHWNVKANCQKFDGARAVKEAQEAGLMVVSFGNVTLANQAFMRLAVDHGLVIGDYDQTGDDDHAYQPYIDADGCVDVTVEKVSAEGAYTYRLYLNADEVRQEVLKLRTVHRVPVSGWALPKSKVDSAPVPPPDAPVYRGQDMIGDPGPWEAQQRPTQSEPDAPATAPEAASPFKWEGDGLYLMRNGEEIHVQDDGLKGDTYPLSGYDKKYDCNRTWRKSGAEFHITDPSPYDLIRKVG